MSWTKFTTEMDVVAHLAAGNTVTEVLQIAVAVEIRLPNYNAGRASQFFPDLVVD